MSKYTFSTLGEDEIKYYPKQFKWEDPQCPPPVGMLDFSWTPDIKFARTWSEQEMVETIANEYYNSYCRRCNFSSFLCPCVFQSP